MYTRWRLYILAVFVLVIGGTLLIVHILRRHGVAVSRLQASLGVVGIVLITETLIISNLSNFNLGVILPAFFGAPLILLAFLLPRMQHGPLAVLKWIIVGCYGLAACIFLVCGAMMLGAKKDADTVKADALIVLGAAVHGDKVTWVLENRLNTAMDYLNKHENAICVVSGGQGAGESVTEASAMQKYMVERGIDPARIYLEEQAVNTLGNFAFSMDIIDSVLGKDARTAFVTTDFHVYRAGAVAHAMGFDLVGIPAPDVWYLSLNNFLRECVGICVYKLRGDI